MPDEQKGIVKSSASGAIKITGRSGLAARIAAASKEAKPLNAEEAFRTAAARISASAEGGKDPATADNRIAILADISGSMNSHVEIGITRMIGDSKLSYLKKALQSFISEVNFDNTSVALYTFPMRNARYDEGNEREAFHEEQLTHGVRYRLSFNAPMLTLAVGGLTAAGGTPMAATITTVITEQPITRAIIISDGDADNANAALNEARQYVEAGIPIDCVHIGDETQGEQLLQDIAKLTGGIYLKFDNVENFSKSFWV